MRTKFATAVLLGALACACTSQTPATSQPPGHHRGGRASSHQSGSGTGRSGRPAGSSRSGPDTGHPLECPFGDARFRAGGIDGTSRARSAAAASGATLSRGHVAGWHRAAVELETALASDASSVEDPCVPRCAKRRDR